MERAGELGQALPLAERAVRQLRAQVGTRGGPRALELGLALGQVADLHCAAYALADAVEALDQALVLLSAGAADQDGLAVHADLLVRRGNVRRLQGRWDEASRDLLEALRVAPGEQHRAGVHNALGILCKDRGDLDGAEAHYLHAQRHLQGAHGADSPVLASLEHNLAGLAYARGRHADGLAHIERASSLRTATGVDQAAVLSDRVVEAALLIGQEQHERAETLLREVIESWSRLRGPDHYEVGHCRHHLAAVLRRQGHPAAAHEQYRLALSIYRRSLGARHPEAVAVEQAMRGLAGR